MARRYIREQRHLCGERYQEIDIYQVTQCQHVASTRAKKRMASRLVQQELNARYSARHFAQLLATNFGAGDKHVTLTYSDNHLPESIEAAEADLELYLDRLRKACKRRGVKAPRYIAVTEYNEDEEGRLTVRYHHHLVISCALSRDELEDLWHVRRGTERLGTVNADRLQPDHGSFEALAEYLTKYPKRKKRWRQSKGLRQPERPRPNDSKYSRRQLERMVRDHLGDKQFWEGQYPGWWLHAVKVSGDTCVGYHVIVQLWRDRPDADRQGPNGRKKKKGAADEKTG